MSRFVGPVALSSCIYLSLLAAVTAAEQDTAARPLPTPRQWKIIAALDEATEFDFTDQPLTDVIEFFQQRHEIEIQLDQKALTDAGIGSDTPITGKISGITLHSVLRLLLSELDLTYVVGDGYLMITSKTEAENKLSSKVYPVRDLVTLDSEFRPPLKGGKKAGADFESLIGLIRNTIATTTWDEVGGPGSINEFDHAQALAISQTDEVHEEIVELLAALRRTRDKQLAAATPVDPFAQQQQQQHAKDEGPFEIKVYRLIRQKGVESQATAGVAPAQKQPDTEVVPAEKSPDAKDAGNAPATEKAAPENRAESNLDAWAKAIAKLLPEMIEPKSWQPSGEGMLRAVGETVVVRQSDEVHYRVGKLVDELLPGSVPASMLAHYPAIRLTLPAVKVGWPYEAEPQPRPTEARINEMLEAQCELDFADHPLSDVMSKLAQRHQVQIHLDQKALTDAGVGTDTPITRTVNGLTLRTALKLLLVELDLTYLIRNEVLIITSQTEAENMLTTKVYPVFDLVVRPPGAPANRPALDFQALIENLSSNIAPTTWDEVGGPGAIQQFTNAGALVISQTTAVHEEVAEFLKALREVGAVQK